MHAISWPVLSFTLTIYSDSGYIYNDFGFIIVFDVIGSIKQSASKLFEN